MHWHGCAGTQCCDAPGMQLQLEVAKRIVTVARKVVSDHSAAIVLCEIAAGGCLMQCAGRARRRIGLQRL